MLKAFKLAATAVVIAVAAAGPAAAKCTRLAFSVNDYGKDGPIKDAKTLLDKYIAQWAAERGIKNYRTGAKDVKCELFLDVILFDEHTCRAEANVCWDEKNVGPVPTGAKVLPDGTAPATSKGKQKAATPAPSTTGALPSVPKPARAPALPPVVPAAVVPSAAPVVAPPAAAPLPAPAAVPPVAPPAPPSAKPESAG